jgi:hypothetical protein
MDGKITLITPPDVFENESYSILFIHLHDEDQEIVSKWLANADIKTNVNIYFYSGEQDINWFFHAMAISEYKYIDLDSLNNVTNILSGYILGKKNIFYKTEDEHVAAICHYINQNRITNIESFLERAFNDKT